MAKLKLTSKKLEKSAEGRFLSTIPLEMFKALNIGIAGMGAVGRNVAILLGNIGTENLFGADPEKIEIVNLGSQGWPTDSVGRYKIQAILDDLPARSSMETRDDKFERQTDWIKDLDVFFCCVDSMLARRTIWTAVRTREKEGGLWLDSRMTPKVIRIVSANLAVKEDIDHYEKSLFSDSKAFQGSCTDRMTLYGAYIAAGLMVSQLVNYLNYGILVRKDFILETLGMTMTDLAKGQ